MKQRSEKQNYFRNLEIGLIIALVLIIFSFRLLPDINFLLPENSFEEKVVLVMEDVPATVQFSAKSVRSKPQVPLIPIESDLDEPELLSDVKIKKNYLLNENESGADLSGVTAGNSLAVRFFNPRQILEVLPKDIDEFNGRIDLSLKLNNEGKVTAHKILSNTTESEHCLAEVLKAAYKSKWEPFLNDKEELWVEKSYIFN